MAKDKRSRAYDRGRVPIRKSPDFNDQQIREMQRLGLFDEEIDELRQCLSSLHATLAPAQPVAPIRKILTGLRKALGSAERALRPVADPLWERDSTHAVLSPLSAKERVMQLARSCVLSSASVDPESLDGAPALLASLAGSVDAALRSLPKQQRKRVFIPGIRKIHAAWLRGHVSRVWTLDGGLRDGTQPPFLGIVTRGDSGLFPQVAQYCFDAVGSSASVESAIRAYLKVEAHRTREGRRRAGFPAEQIDSVGRRGRPRGRSPKRN
jgi:hypothetical protein